jgi:hypothetical protein
MCKNLVQIKNKNNLKVLSLLLIICGGFIIIAIAIVIIYIATGENKRENWDEAYYDWMYSY